eukprot:g9229.t1
MKAKSMVDERFVQHASLVTNDSDRIGDEDKEKFATAARNSLIAAYCSSDYRILSGTRDPQDPALDGFRAAQQEEKHILHHHEPGAAPTELFSKRLAAQEPEYLGNQPGHLAVEAWRKHLRSEKYKSPQAAAAFMKMLCRVHEISPRHQGDVEVRIANLKAKQQELRCAYRAIPRIFAKDMRQLIGVQRRKAAEYLDYGTDDSDDEDQLPPVQYYREVNWHDLAKEHQRARPGGKVDRTSEQFYRDLAVRENQKLRAHQEQREKRLESRRMMKLKQFVARRRHANTVIRFWDAVEKLARERFFSNIGRDGAGKRAQGLDLDLSDKLAYSKAPMLDELRKILHADVLPGVDKKLLAVVRTYKEPPAGVEKVVAWLAGARQQTIDWNDLSEFFRVSIDPDEREEEDDEAGLDELSENSPSIGQWWEENRQRFIVLDFRKHSELVRNARRRAAEGNPAPLLAAAARPDPFPEAVAVLWVERAPFSFVGLKATFADPANSTTKSPKLRKRAVVLVEDQEDDLLADENEKSQPLLVEIEDEEQPDEEAGGAVVEEKAVFLPRAATLQHSAVFSSHQTRKLLRHLDLQTLSVAAVNPIDRDGRMEIVWKSEMEIPHSGNRSSKQIGSNFSKAPGPAQKEKSQQKAARRMFEQFADALDKHAKKKPKGTQFYRASEWWGVEEKRLEDEAKKKSGSVVAAAGGSAAASSKAKVGDNSKADAEVGWRQLDEVAFGLTKESQKQVPAAAGVVKKSGDETTRSKAVPVYYCLSEGERKRILREYRNEADDLNEVPGFQVSVGAPTFIKVEATSEQLRDALQLILKARDMPVVFATSSSRGVRTFAFDPRTEGPTAARRLALLWAKRASLLLDMHLKKDKLRIARFIGPENITNGVITLDQRVRWVESELRPFVVAIEGDTSVDPPAPPLILTGKQATAFSRLKHIDRIICARMVNTDFKTAMQEPTKPPRKKRGAANEGQ